MGIFGMFKGKSAEAINQFTGNTDFLQGLCSAAAMTAAASGGIDDAEYDKTLSVIQSNAAISAAFNASQIEAEFARLSKKTGTRSGRNELKDEIRQVLARDKTGKMGYAICLAALDVADEGGVDDAEKAVLADICEICGVNYQKLLAS